MSFLIDSRFPPLYKLDSRGKLREWHVAAEGESYTVSYGISGKLHSKTVNTPGESAREKAYENWRNMLEDDYTVNLNKLLGKPFSPMQGGRYLRSRKTGFPVMVHRLYKGFRCISREKMLFSETGEILENLRHLAKWTRQLDPVVHLDGYLVSGSLSEDELEASAREKIDGLKSTSIKFIVCDAFFEDVPEAPYDYRLNMIQTIIQAFEQDGCRCIEIAPVYTAEFPEVLDGYMTRFEREGFEGMVVRSIRGMYRVGEESDDVLIYEIPGVSKRGKRKRKAGETGKEMKGNRDSAGSLEEPLKKEKELKKAGTGKSKKQAIPVDESVSRESSDPATTVKESGVDGAVDSKKQRGKSSRSRKISKSSESAGYAGSSESVVIPLKPDSKLKARKERKVEDSFDTAVSDKPVKKARKKKSSDEDSLSVVAETRGSATGSREENSRRKIKEDAQKLKARKKSAESPGSPPEQGELRQVPGESLKTSDRAVSRRKPQRKKSPVGEMSLPFLDFDLGA